jgi:hypothetical protein
MPGTAGQALSSKLMASGLMPSARMASPARSQGLVAPSPPRGWYARRLAALLFRGWAAAGTARPCSRSETGSRGSADRRVGPARRPFQNAENAAAFRFAIEAIARPGNDLRRLAGSHRPEPAGSPSPHRPAPDRRRRAAGAFGLPGDLAVAGSPHRRVFSLSRGLPPRSRGTPRARRRREPLHRSNGVTPAISKDMGIRSVRRYVLVEAE